MYGGEKEIRVGRNIPPNSLVRSTELESRSISSQVGSNTSIRGIEVNFMVKIY